MVHYQAIQKIKIFCIKQKKKFFRADLGHISYLNVTDVFVSSGDTLGMTGGDSLSVTQTIIICAAQVVL